MTALNAAVVLVTALIANALVCDLIEAIRSVS